MSPSLPWRHNLLFLKHILLWWPAADNSGFNNKSFDSISDCDLYKLQSNLYLAYINLVSNLNQRRPFLYRRLLLRNMEAKYTAGDNIELKINIFQGYSLTYINIIHANLRGISIVFCATVMVLLQFRALIRHTIIQIRQTATGNRSQILGGGGHVEGSCLCVVNIDC